MRPLVLVSVAATLFSARAHAGDAPPGAAAGRPSRPVTGPTTGVGPARPWLASASEEDATPAGAGPESGRVAVPEAEDDAPAEPAATVELAVSTTSRYLYRGLLVEDQGAIVQSSLDLRVPVLVGDGLLRQLDLGATVWTSLGTGPTGTGGDNEAPRAFSEVDWTLSAVATLADGWTLGATYVAFRYPNGSADPVDEVAFGVGYDDGPRWPEGGRFRGLAPTAMVAFETHGQSDGGRHPGVYLGIGIAPKVSLTTDPEGATLAFPVTAGFSLSAYYEDAEGADDTFGYVELGPELELPLGGREGGPSFSVTFGLHVLLAGDHVRLYNATDEPELVAFLTFKTSF